MRQHQKISQFAKQAWCLKEIAPWDHARVRIKQGTVLGATLDRPNTTGKFFSFFGIPYGETSQGMLRFKPSRGIPRWNVDRDCTKMCHSSCKEDCLTLNIHSPNTRPRILQPVAVFLHGSKDDIPPGGPDYLVEQGLVVIEPRWRKGPLGFLSLMNSEISGNVGAKDLVSALRWIRENAASFGGDPRCVTLFGCGGEAAALAHALLLSPLTRGLIHRVGLQGGSLDCRPMVRDPRSSAIKLSKAMGLESSDLRDVARVLRNATVEGLSRAVESVRETDFNESSSGSSYVPICGPGRFWLCAEPRGVADRLLTTVSPPAFSAVRVPLLIGYNEHEGLDLVSEALRRIETLSQDLRPAMPLAIGSDITITPSFEKRVRSFYFGQSTVRKSLPDLIDLLSDSNTVRGVHTTVRALACLMPATYFYRFSFDAQRVERTLRGVGPGDEMYYLFKTNFNTRAITDKPQNEAENFVRTNLVRMWCNFAKFGDPTPVHEGHTQDEPGWLPATPCQMNYMHVTEKLEMSTDPFPERMEFWDDIARTNARSHTQQRMI